MRFRGRASTQRIRGVLVPGIRRVVLMSAAVVALLSGCGEGRGSPAPDRNAIPAAAPVLPPSDGLLASAELQEVVKLQLARDGGGLIALLGSADPAIRARAAFGLASVWDPAAAESLLALLSDPAPAVRANAAFALGYLPLPDGGARLLTALEGESDPEARRRLIQTLGRRGNAEAIARLAEMNLGEADEVEWTLALAEGGRRGSRAEPLRRALAERLTHRDADLRLAAASYFGQTPTAGSWFTETGFVRGALDAYALHDPAGAHLAVALSRLGNVAQDRDRILRWMTRSTDWRTRVAVAAAVGTEGPWAGDPVVSEALWGLMEDRSGHVRATAAAALSRQLAATPEAFDRTAAWVADPARDWRTQLPFLETLVAGGRSDLVLAWTRGVAGTHPFATMRGMDALAMVEGVEVTDLFFGFSESADPLVRGTAFRLMASRWHQIWEGDETFDRYLDLFRRGLRDSAALPAVWSARALSTPEVSDLQVDRDLMEAFLERREAGDPNILAPLVVGLGSSAEPLLQELAAGPDPLLAYTARIALSRVAGTPVPAPAGPLSPPFREVDWSALAAAGAAPRVRLTTEHGDLLLRLYPEEAPLTVQLFLEQVASGAHDGVAIHRVVPGVLVQGGDFTMGDGTGRTPYGVRTEITRLPIRRGVVGMASTGPDTEGSQFFFLQADHISLEGSYTAFGWIEEGWEVLDLLQEGDRVLSARVE